MIVQTSSLCSGRILAGLLHRGCELVLGDRSRDALFHERRDQRFGLPHIFADLVQVDERRDNAEGQNEHDEKQKDFHSCTARRRQSHGRVTFVNSSAFCSGRILAGFLHRSREPVLGDRSSDALFHEVGGTAQRKQSHGGV